MDSKVGLLFSSWAEREQGTVVQLLNRAHVPVAALYLDKLQFENIVISEAKGTTEKYYIYFGGIGIFFSYYKKGGNPNV